MSRVLLLDPHGDDACLFAFFTLMREKPHVAVVLRSFVQQARGIPVTADEREAETRMALIVPQTTYEFWPYRDDTPDWAAIARRITALAPFYGLCYHPEPEPDGQAHHNLIGEIAKAAFGARAVGYLTYTSRSKSTWGHRVDYEPTWIGDKLAALTQFQSQYELPATGTGAHFLRGLDEYTA